MLPFQEKLTKLSYRQELERFLSYGKWDLTDEDIERINKDEENRQRVSIFTNTTNTLQDTHDSFSRIFYSSQKFEWLRGKGEKATEHFRNFFHQIKSFSFLNFSINCTAAAYKTSSHLNTSSKWTKCLLTFRSSLALSKLNGFLLDLQSWLWSCT